MKIGDFSKLSRITVRMLRYYEEQGLLTPQRIDPDTGYRHYSASQLTTAFRILSLREMGFSVATIADILASCDSPDDLRRYLHIRQTELQDELHKAQGRLALLQSSLEQMKKEMQTMTYDVILKDMPKTTILSLRDIIPAYDQEGQLWGRFMGATTGQKIPYKADSKSLAIFHDSDYKEHDVDVEIGITLGGPCEPIGELRCREMPAHKAACAIMRGAFSQMNEASRQVADWIEKNGYTMDGVMYNIYHVAPGMEPNPDNWVTELVFPVK